MRSKISRKLCFLVFVGVTIVSASVLVGRSRFAAPDKARSAAPQALAVSEVPLKAASNPPPDATLAREIDRAIDESELNYARWGLFVMSLKDGRVVYSRNSDRLFTPASNLKVFTTAVALDLLGAGYRWRTSVYAEKQPDSSGVIDGDLTLYGRGAADLVSFRKQGAPSLVELADQLYQRGVRRVHGDVVGDESYFRAEPYGDGWQWNDLQWYFGAEPSALTVDANAIDLTIAPANQTGQPAKIEFSRQTNFLRLTNITTTVERGAATTVGINRGLSNNEVQVWGEFPARGHGFTAALSVHDPALWAATLFKESLVARGIAIEGEPRRRDFRVAEKDSFEPKRAVELAYVDSETLGEIARATNKQSINLNAELILRTLGKERGAMLPEPDSRKAKLRGDDEAGAGVLRLWLERNGISTKGFEIRDGSGLSRLDLITPEATARLLAAIARTGSASVFHESLPIAGRDGTLKGRLVPLAGRVFAKTGSLTYDHSLSGYASTRNQEVLAFSIYCNDATGHTNAIRMIDEIVGILCGL